MNNSDVARIFYKMASLSQFLDENPFKTRAYEKAARNIESLDVDIRQLSGEGKLETVPGIGRAIAKKIMEILETGTCKRYEEMKSEVPVDIFQLLDIPGIGPKTVQLVYKHLGVTTLDELEKAAVEHRIRKLPRMGVKQEEKILRSIRRSKGKEKRIPLGMALPIAESVMKYLKQCPDAENITPTGSLRRRKETVRDIDLIATSDHPESVIRAFTTIPEVTEVIGSGTTKASVIFRDIQIDLRIVDRSSFGSLLQHFTGSKEHNIRLREIAIKKGFKLSEYGITDQKTGTLMPCGSEEEVYQRLDLPFIVPELREDRGEIEAAIAGTLPDLITLNDIRGDLHVHSTWSDGANTIPEMVDFAMRLGYEYICISDHSRSRTIARGLSEEKLIEKIAEIDRINENLDGFRVLTGSEVDILADGTLDYDDRILAMFDIVVAAVHSGFSQDRRTMTSRIVRAIENEFVDILAHPTGRLLGERIGYEVDIDRVIEVAAETGTIIEINAFPSRLDLNDINARKAKESGVMLAIDTDAHSVDHLKFMDFGVQVARRAWLEPGDVLNTMSVTDVLKRVG
ncbi:MAG: DNA polymerase/3'-5' exonuclease PolX [Methanosarcinales archaeon]|nr:DNA polymerase/3'-5' exonuclease PolX [Methanosarcinales archaeon]